MAKQVGPHFFIGTIGDLVFYKMNGEYYVRKKSSYNKRKMQKAGAYPLMHLKQSEFGQASKLASEVYSTLPRKKRNRALYNALTSQALKLLRAGVKPESIEEQLLKGLEPIAMPAAPVIQALSQIEPHLPKIKKHVQLGLSSWQVRQDGVLQKDSNSQLSFVGVIVIPDGTKNLVTNCSPCQLLGPNAPQKE